MYPNDWCPLSWRWRILTLKRTQNFRSCVPHISWITGFLGFNHGPSHHRGGSCPLWTNGFGTLRNWELLVGTYTTIYWGLWLWLPIVGKPNTWRLLFGHSLNWGHTQPRGCFDGPARGRAPNFAMKLGPWKLGSKEKISRKHIVLRHPIVGQPDLTHNSAWILPTEDFFGREKWNFNH